MRDNGPRRGFRVRRSRFYLLLAFFVSLPFICVLLATQCWFLWRDNINLRQNVEKFELDYQKAEARAERLENLEELLREESLASRNLIMRRLAEGASEPHQHSPAEKSESGSPGSEPALAEGPGHEEFPALDSGRVKVSNVQARVIRGHSLRIGLDLRNPDNESLLSGEVDATLITSNGERHELAFSPRDVGSFRINRFKRTVMIAQVPASVSMNNAQLILEVLDHAGEPIFRNIFAIQH